MACALVAPTQLIEKKNKGYQNWYFPSKVILKESIIDKKEMQHFLKERHFWSNLLIIIMLLLETWLLGVQKKYLDQSAMETLSYCLSVWQKGNHYWMNCTIESFQVKPKTTTWACIAQCIQNKWIQLLEKEAKNESVQQLKLAKYFAIILDYTLDVCHQVKLTITHHYVQCRKFLWLPSS